MSSSPPSMSSTPPTFSLGTPSAPGQDARAGAGVGGGTTRARSGAPASTDASSSASDLVASLERLSVATSQSTAREGYAARTFRSVSSSLSAVWGDSDGTGYGQHGLVEPPATDSGSSTTPGTPRRRPSVDTTNIDTTAILYPTLENHPAPLAHPLLALDLAALTALPHEISNDALLAALLGRLEPWVGEEGEGGYCLVVLAAEGERGRSLPGVAWWLWHWRRIPRKYRKNLKRLYIVHPSTLTRTALPVILPLLSPKSYAKLYTVPTLLALGRRGVSLRGVDVGPATLAEETRVLRAHPELAGALEAAPSASLSPLSPFVAPIGWGYSALSSVLGTASSYLPFGATTPAPTAEADAAQAQATLPPPSPSQPYWSQEIDDIVGDTGSLPRVLRELGATILADSTETEGIFRRGTNNNLLPGLQALLDLPPALQPSIDWPAVTAADPLLPAVLYKRLLSGVATPLLPRSSYPLIAEATDAAGIRALLASLSPARAAVLKHTTHIAHHLLASEQSTRMGARALAVVFAPALIRGPDPREDAALCLHPGQVLPGIVAHGQTLAGMLEYWIEHWTEVSGEAGSGDKLGASTEAEGKKQGQEPSQDTGPTKPNPAACRCRWTSSPSGALTPITPASPGKHYLLGGTGKGANAKPAPPVATA